ncbi:hypothetical protein LPJ61_002602 [Coemansia biformis]|uniref:G-patch domain-containing protein n=1 Tax=Coemansia biformis TaxID=1286918 RepID=A0A9W8CYI2_9FUNG|nr:hypothetical protein LPJ61_002602 [Coemansia biformis]
MSRQFEDDLSEYLCAKGRSEPATAPVPAAGPEISHSPAAPLDGFEVSADPRYAYSKDSGHWLDLHTGIVSYYDTDAQVYVPLRLASGGAPGTAGFAGVARLVVADSPCLAVGHVVEIGADDGLDVGRDRVEAGDIRHLRVPEMEVSRHHARIYFGSDDAAFACGIAVAAEDAGSEDGEIGGESGGESGGEPGDFEKMQAVDDLSEGECQGESDAVRAAAASAASKATAHEPGFYVVDQGSTHGTFVNQQRLSEPKTASRPWRLRHRDQVAVGGTTFEVHIHEQWACAECKNTGSNEIATLHTSAPEASPATSSALRANLQQERIDNLRALKRRYMPSRRRAGDKMGVYADRARLRRSLQSNMQTAAARESELEGAGQSAHTEAHPATDPVASAATALGQDNMGYALLRRMGWSPGSGLGADQSGIVAPVGITGNEGRSGLGAPQPPAGESPQSRVSRITRERFHEC